MKCAWDGLLSVLPPWMRQELDRLGRETMEELRLRLGQVPSLVLGTGEVRLDRPVHEEDLQYVVNGATKYSPWASATTARGYITIRGGHRIGLAGETVVQQGKVTGFRRVTSLCIRVAREFPGIAKGLPLTDSVLILGPPGSGKTTLLRDLIRLRSEAAPGSLAVVDEREELFPQGVDRGPRTDVLTGCSKAQGLDMALRTLGPTAVAVDEITAPEDCQALIRAGWSGVDLLATAHGSGPSDLENRPVYRMLTENKLFDHLVVLRRDKSWHLERMCE